LPGSVGDLVGSIGGGVIAALLFSFFVAMTITASLAGLTAQEGRGGSGRPRWWQDGVGHPRLTGLYRRGLRRALALPAAAMMLAAFPPLSGFVLAGSMGNELFPPVDRDMFELKLWLPTWCRWGCRRICCAAVPTCWPPSASCTPQQPASASPPQTSIRGFFLPAASAWRAALRSVRVVQPRRVAGAESQLAGLPGRPHTRPHRGGGGPPRHRPPALRADAATSPVPLGCSTIQVGGGRLIPDGR
jgi:hypothetical protein